MQHKSLDDVMDQMKTVGDSLVPYNYPRNNPHLEDDIHLLKVAETSVDGYEIVIYFSRADYGSHFLETVQIFGKSIPFLPFSVVTKVARRYLGGHHLSLVELPGVNRKIYCWTICLDTRGRPIASPYDGKIEICDYEGFKYGHMQPDQVNLI